MNLRCCESVGVDCEGAILNEPAPQVALSIYIANMLKSLKAKSMEDDAQLGIMGHPNARPSRRYLKPQHPTAPLCRVCIY